MRFGGPQVCFSCNAFDYGGATALIGFLPTYATIGIAAPIILLLIRALQGLRWEANTGAQRSTLRTRSRCQARLLYELYTNHCNSWSVFIPCGRPVRPKFHEPGSVYFVALAYSLCHLDFPGGHLALHPFADEGVADLQSNKKRGHYFGATLEGSFYEMAKSITRFYFTLRSYRGTRSCLVHGTVLRIVLSANNSKVNGRAANYIVAIALLFGMALVWFLCALSDRIGRKWIMMTGCLLAALAYIPIYRAMQSAAVSAGVIAESSRIR